MKLRHIACAVSLMVTPGIAVAAGLYKCESADGGVSFQDQPCASTEKEEVRRQGPTLIPTGEEGASLVQVSVPGVGEAFVPVFDTMTVRVHRHGKSAVTAVLKSKSGEEPMELKITLFANSAEQPYNVISAREYLRSIDPNLVRHRMRYGEGWDFSLAFAEARMYSYAQGGQPHSVMPATGYTTTTTGFAKHPQVVVWILILNDGGRSESLKRALRVLNAMQIRDNASGEVL